MVWITLLFSRAPSVTAFGWLSWAGVCWASQQVLPHCSASQQRAKGRCLFLCHCVNDFPPEPRGIHQTFSIGVVCPLSYLSLVLEKVQHIFTTLAWTCPLLQNLVIKDPIVPLGTTRNHALLLFPSLPWDYRGFPEAHLPPKRVK